jgi:hypothetical protein
VTQLAFRTLCGAVMALGLFGASNVAARQAVSPDVHYVPTPTQVVDRMLELASPASGELLMDLGSGDGRIPIAAVKRFGVRAIGIDIDPKRISEAKANAKAAGVEDKVEFRQANLFESDISKANVITLYLLETLNAKLRPRLLEELQPGSRIVSHAFSMGDWQPETQERVDGRSVYFWIVPARIEGRWRMDGGTSAGAELDLKQTYQMVSGTARLDGREIPIQDGRLRGAEFTFKLDGQTYTGKADGSSIVSTGGDTWRASRY